MGGYQVRIVGLERVQRMFERAPQITTDELEAAMKKAVISVSSEVKKAAPVGVSSRLRNSIGGSVVAISGKRVTGRVGTSLDEPYPAVMEFGRKPGARRPPTARLVRWVQLRLGVPGQDAIRVAAYVAGSIARRGIRGRRYFRTGWDNSNDRVRSFFDTAVANIIRKMEAG